MEIPIEFCVSARAYRPATGRKFLLVSILIAVYAIVIPYVYITAGEPRKAAIIHAQKLADEKWAADSLLQNETSAEILEAITEPLVSPSLGFSSTTEAGDISAEEFETSNLAFGVESTSSAATSGGFLSGWFGPTKEQKRAQAEFEKWQKQFNERSKEGPAVLPPSYLPSAWACLALFATITAHALFHLLCHWIVGFRASMLFSPASKVDDGVTVLVVPPPNRGKPAMVTAKKSAASGAIQMEFQRQTYIYTASAKLGESAKDFPNGVFSLSACPVDLPISHYTSSTGIPSDSEVEKVQDRWGRNHLAVPVPSFLELLQLQLLTPLAIFQIFCALLWLLDEYWTYTLWTLTSVVIFEATTVFQRTRTQAMLGGMAPKPTPIYVWRCRKWTVLTTKELLPGDLISLAFKKRASNQQQQQQQQQKAVSVTPQPAPAAGGQVAVGGSVDDDTINIPPTSRDEVVPCDCLLLTGAAVVNEASLTGESVPQMKEAVVAGELDTSTGEEVVLDINGRHRVSTLYSGTSLVTVNASASSEQDSRSSSTAAQGLASGVPPPPDGGAIAYVLRTGFSSSQGALLQMIEFSQQTVSGDARETGMALLLLFFFALLAAGYVLKEGLRKKEKTTHEILLKCVIIITSVVPRQFPMQMAMAVNMALMALSKAGIFCTEPFRVPLAGKVTHCLFDKTGTLTTDQLVPVGIISPLNPEFEAVDETNGEVPSFRAVVKLNQVASASGETAMVLAACHSLIMVDDPGALPAAPAPSVDGVAPPAATGPPAVTQTLVGDPIELAAMTGVSWSWDAPSSTATPGAWQTQAKALDLVRAKVAEMRAIPPANRAPTFAPALYAFLSEAVTLEGKIAEAKRKASEAPFAAVTVVQRHHFSSQLQRMSVVCKCVTPSSTSSSGSVSGGKTAWYCLVKGSPEALKTLLVPGTAPEWYSSTYEALARRGLRVLALAHRRVSASEEAAFAAGTGAKDQPRTWVEANLTFSGFIAFECKIRADSKIVVKALRAADHKVAMLTGDALLTSLHVARQVDICAKSRPTLTLHATAGPETPSAGTGAAASLGPHWVRRHEPDGREEVVPYSPDTVAALAKDHDLLTTEADLMAVAEDTGDKDSPLWKHVEHFQVFARMSPPGKASIIRYIQQKSSNVDAHVFMCGDGGNDVGALKQADVGIALLAGHANANTTEDVENAVVPATAEATATATATAAVGTPGGPSAEDSLNAHDAAIKQRSEKINALRAAHMKDFQARFTKEQQVTLQEDMRKLTEKGDYMGIFSLMKNQAGNMKRAMDAENMRFMALHGQVWDPKKDGDGAAGAGGLGSIEDMMKQMDAGESAGGLPMVRPGDASVAAPFTSRVPSVRAVVDLIRQGRCTLLSALMQQQIMMLESIIAAYTLSALSLHNARSSERQMMASSWLIMTAAISFSYASPLDHMHPLRPLRSLFHPAIILSILGQAAIHIACMTLAVHWATEVMGPDKLKEVTEFFRKAKAKEIDVYANCGEDDFMCQMNAFWSAPFLPNLLNSTIFLVETSQMISVFFANYKGRPWMKGMMENHALFLSVFMCVGGVIVASWEMVPQLNELIQLAPFPDDIYRYKVVALVMATIAGTFLWDRLCTMMFAPNVFGAIMTEARKTTVKDLYPILLTAGKVVAVIALLGTGNILLMGGAFWWYRSYTSKKAVTPAPVVGASRTAAGTATGGSA